MWVDLKIRPHKVSTINCLEGPPGSAWK